MAKAWYAYNGIGLARDPGSYLYSPVPPLCVSGFNVCAIYADYNGTNPSAISNNLKLYIGAGLLTGLSQPQVPLGTKKYVYMKP
ncbi:hypothetical protein [Pararcticibacter amylolyticus]|uniref:Uncharacterized protein n=1 Tax=Pararcticibacter amylolyticus TaxID=2173175 RepID=A0A2U2PGE3_9SPHI|nr:hypothetical protein [Pararcticibacter amylolyticus]PWG80199.1 hypothetical protein DDR33_13480 [Pararcticibacter amylolyticus]